MVLKQRDPSVDESEEYEEFIKEVAAYCEKRGVPFEAKPKVGPRHLDLFKLYTRVTEEGGYDKVSDTRGNKLAWRRIATEFLPGNANIVQLAFQVKSAYYKNLAAYEISTIHKKEPPPPEILEELTAKGGDLLNRTLENYHRRANREVDMLANGNDSDSDEDGNKTPKADKMDVDEPSSTGGRVTRGLRQAPPQRVLFGQQPDPPSARQNRAAAQSNNSPVPGGAATSTASNQANGSYSTSGAAASISSYEPGPTPASTVKPVMTPTNNPEHFRALARRQRDRILRKHGAMEPSRGFMLPGTGFPGPNIYMRCMRALESGMREEVDYALHHFVKISHERGDKFRFDQFVNVADNLMYVVCGVSTAWYDIKEWHFTWNDEYSDEPDVLNQIRGTSNLLQKISSHTPLFVDGLYSPEFRHTMQSVCHAALVIRNMIMLEDNARFLADLPLVRDMITIVLRLPDRHETVEIKYYILEIAEQLTKFWHIDQDDHVYSSLIHTLETNLYDRGMIILCMRSLSRIAMNLEFTNRLDGIPPKLLRTIHEWLLVPDEELRAACLDLLYQYTAFRENVENLIKVVDTENLVAMLFPLLLYGAVRVEFYPESQEQIKPLKPRLVTETLPKLAPSVVEKLCEIENDREQSAAWLRTCFEADPDGEITQLALWSAYNDAFAGAPIKRSLMQAKDFITNVTAVFPNASARVVPNEEDRSRSKYTMKGISPRAVPVDFRGRPYVHCYWRDPLQPPTDASIPNPTDASKWRECDMWYSSANPDEFWKHLVGDHLKVPRDPDNPNKFHAGTLRGTGRRFACNWAGCGRYPYPGTDDAYNVCMHLKLHVPNPNSTADRRKAPATPSRDSSTTHTAVSTPGAPATPSAAPRDKANWFHLNTPTDDQGHPVGLPFSALLVLRNLARTMSKIDEGNPGGHVERCFSLHRRHLYFVMAYNQSLREYLPQLEYYVSESMVGIEELPPLLDVKGNRGAAEHD